MDIFLGVLSGLIILTLLVVVHELGHAIAAIRSGVVVEEFGIGFPPMIFSKKLKNGINFSLNLLPIGGFVKLKGEYDAADKKGDYGAATFWQKTKILFAGIFANWLVAIVLLSAMALIGMPKILPNQFTVPVDSYATLKPVEIVQLTPDYPAENAGLQVGDKIIRFDNQEVNSVDDVIDISQNNRGEIVNVIYDRGDSEYSLDIKLKSDEGPVFGASLGQGEVVRSTWSAPIVGFVSSLQFTQATFSEGVFKPLGNFFSGLVMQFSSDESVREQAALNIESAGDSIAGPVGILGSIFPSAQKAGISQLVFLTAIISISLAAFNLLPLPALDGGRWLIGTIFVLFRKKLTRKLEERIQFIGFSILMGLVILVTVGDVARIF